MKGTRILKIPVLLVIVISILAALYFVSEMTYWRRSEEFKGEIYQNVLKYGKDLRFKEVPVPLLKLNGTHPRLYLTSERIRELRVLINGSYKDLWLKERSWVDKGWLDKKPSDVYYHDPKEMLWQRRVGNQIPHYAFCFLMTQNVTYLYKAKEWISAALGYQEWGPYPDLAKAHLLYGVSIAYDWLYHNLTSQEREMIRDRLALEARLMFLASVKTREYKTEWWHRAYLQNHLWVNLCGLGTAGLALYGEVPDAEIWINQANIKFKKVLDSLGSDGASHEGVGYWSYGTEYLLKYIDLAKQLLGYDLFNNSWLENTVYYRLYMGLPKALWKEGMSCIDFADSPRRDWYGPDYILRKLAAEYKNGYAQWLAEELDKAGLSSPTSRWLNLLWYDPSVPATPPTDLPTMKRFDNLDIVVMRSDWSEDETLFAFKCGPYIGHKALEEFDYDPGGGHVHPDVNHFVLVSHGKWLIIDDGYADKRTRQHNTILINGRGQLGEGSVWFKGSEVIKSKGTSEIIRAESNPIFDYVIGDAYGIYPRDLGLRRFLRHVIYLKPDIFIIVDELETWAPSTFEWLLHYEGTLQKIAEDTFILTNGDVSLKIEVIFPHGFNYEIYQEKVVKSESKYERSLPTLKISPKQEVHQVVFMVLLHPAKTGEQHPTVAEIEEDGKMGLVIKHEGKERKIFFDFMKPEKNSRIFELINEQVPAS